MSAFNVFLDHWMREENKAKRMAFLQRKRVQINGSVINKLLVKRFGELLALFHRFGQADEELRRQLKHLGQNLVMCQAVCSPCRTCNCSVLKHEKDFRTNSLFVVCQNEHCRDVMFCFMGLFD